MRNTLACALAGAIALAASTMATAQEIVPLPVSGAAEPARASLPANTEVLLSMNQEVTTKGKRWNEGDTFNLSVMHDVVFGDYVVIPRGSRAVGRITWLTNKGAFGKSGKMDIELEYIEVGGRRIDIDGTYRQEGEGNTVATIGGVVLVGVFAGFITGKSAVIPRGRELAAHTEADLPLAISGPAPVQQVAMPVRPMATAASARAETVQPAGLRPESAVECVTCR